MFQVTLLVVEKRITFANINNNKHKKVQFIKLHSRNNFLS